MLSLRRLQLLILDHRGRRRGGLHPQLPGDVGDLVRVVRGVLGDPSHELRGDARAVVEHDLDGLGPLHLHRAVVHQGGSARSLPAEHLVRRADLLADLPRQVSDLRRQLARPNNGVVDLGAEDLRLDLQHQRVHQLVDEELAGHLGTVRLPVGHHHERRARGGAGRDDALRRVQLHAQRLLSRRRHGPRERGRHVRVVAQRQRELLGRRLEVGDVELRVLRGESQTRQLHLRVDLDELRVTGVEADRLQERAELPRVARPQRDLDLGAGARPEHHAGRLEDEVLLVRQTPLLQRRLVRAVEARDGEPAPATEVDAAARRSDPGLDGGLVSVLARDRGAPAQDRGGAGARLGHHAREDVDHLVVRHHGEGLRRGGLLFPMMPQLHEHGHVRRVVDEELRRMPRVRPHHAVVYEASPSQLDARRPHGGREVDLERCRRHPRAGLQPYGQIHHQLRVQVRLTQYSDCHAQRDALARRDDALVRLHERRTDCASAGVAASLGRQRRAQGVHALGHVGHLLVVLVRLRRLGQGGLADLVRADHPERALRARRGGREPDAESRRAAPRVPEDDLAAVGDVGEHVADE
mmetsp:Transcript_70491/g.206730  ORF Transcript_70491/g.206730 Transcript_70491/m.206730 type:complete len:581 (-) Transcript_70491:2322-4064(-)